MIFVDGLSQRRTIWGGDVAAHMVSDTSLAELKAFAEDLRLPQYWLQLLVVPHYELYPMWRVRALRAGAVDCSGLDRQAEYLAELRRYAANNPAVFRQARAG